MHSAAQLSSDLEDALIWVKGSVTGKGWWLMGNGLPSHTLPELKMDIVMKGHPAQITGIPLS